MRGTDGPLRPHLRDRRAARPWWEVEGVGTLRHLVTLSDFSSEEIHELLETARNLKLEARAGVEHTMLRGKSLAMVFQKPSLRTRVSFEVGMAKLGGRALYLGPDDIKLGSRETTEDIAVVLSRYVDGIMARVFAHDDILELANHATVPVINGLCERYHPCQALADVLTIWEKRRRLEGLTLAFLGDGNNVAHSLIHACSKLGMTFRIACPEGYEPNEEVVATARSIGGEVAVVHDPAEAVDGADIVYTDVWTSMGQEEQAEEKQKAFTGFTVDRAVLDRAAKEVVLLHCLPAHYGEEITYEASRDPRSGIFDQAENRLHAQNAVLVRLMT
ncbi:MAG: ornithine carbamoyltransferase [Candidatus Bipolaricaulota bacterium]|nr:MAG: ornithine carbamoyltransferase [Candidatus Bipolaricaulota bacterium]